MCALDKIDLPCLSAGFLRLLVRGQGEILVFHHLSQVDQRLPYPPKAVLMLTSASPAISLKLKLCQNVHNLLLLLRNADELAQLGHDFIFDQAVLDARASWDVSKMSNSSVGAPCGADSDGSGQWLQ